MHGLRGIAPGIVDDTAIAVHYLGDELGIAHLSVGHDGGIGVDQFQQLHVGRAQCERRRIVEFRLHAHAVGGLDDVVNAHFHAGLHGHAVDALGKGGAQRHGVAGEVAVGVVGRPGHFLLLAGIVDHDAHIAVAATVAGSEALVHGSSIDESLECGTRLTHGSHFVVFPRIVVNVAHPSLDMACLRLHGHKTGVHEANHVADAVHGAHHGLTGTVVVEERHLMGQIQVVVDGVGVAFELAAQGLVNGQAAGYVFYEMGYGLVMLVLPGVHTLPVAVEALLDNAHLLHHRGLGIGL